MSGMWGNKLKVFIFGEFYGVGIGIIIDGFLLGVEINMEDVMKEMVRCVLGKSKLFIVRKEGDILEILSGFF